MRSHKLCLLLAVAAGIVLAATPSMAVQWKDVKALKTLEVGRDGEVMKIDRDASTMTLVLGPASGTRYPLSLTLTPKRAAGASGLYLNVTQTTNALSSGSMQALDVVANAGSNANTGAIRGAQIKARQPDAGCTDLVAVYLSVDQKDQTCTNQRGLEVSIDGDAGGAATTTQGVVVFNNSSGSQGNCYAFDVNAGTPSGHGSFTADLRGQNGELFDNATNDTWKLTSGVLKHAYDATDYWTATQADNGSVTFDSASSGTPGFTFSDAVHVGTGYSGTGASVSTAGAGQFDGKVTADGGLQVDTTAFVVTDATGAISSSSSLSSQTTEGTQETLTFATDSTWITGTNITYSSARGSAAQKIVGTYTGVDGAYEGIDIKIATSGAHTADGAGVIGVKSVVTNSAAMNDGNIFGGQFIAKHSHATNDMGKSAALIGLEGWAYPANGGFAGTLIGGNFGYHIEATTENFPNGSVARGVQIFCDDASSNTDPTEETALELWNMAGDQDNAIQITHSGSGFTYFLATQSIDGCFSADTGSPAATTTHKIKVNMNGVDGYIPVYADY